MDGSLLSEKAKSIVSSIPSEHYIYSVFDLVDMRFEGNTVFWSIPNEYLTPALGLSVSKIDAIIAKKYHDLNPIFQWKKGRVDIPVVQQEQVPSFDLEKLADMIAAKMVAKSGDMMSHADAAKYLGISEGTLYNWVSEGLIVPSSIGGKVNQYSRADLDRVAQQRKKKSKPVVLKGDALYNSKYGL